MPSARRIEFSLGPWRQWAAKRRGQDRLPRRRVRQARACLLEFAPWPIETQTELVATRGNGDYTRDIQLKGSVPQSLPAGPVCGSSVRNGVRTEAMRMVPPANS